jgi:hypothetical protein
MPWRGVRISWLIEARNSVFDAFAASAFACASSASSLARVSSAAWRSRTVTSRIAATMVTSASVATRVKAPSAKISCPSRRRMRNTTEACGAASDRARAVATTRGRSCGCTTSLMRRCAASSTE